VTKYAERNSKSSFYKSDFVRYKVKSRLLKILIEGGKYDEEHTIAGYTTNGHMGFARFALERLVRFSFGIQRFPGYEDRIYFNKAGGDSFSNDFFQWADFFDHVVSEEEIKEALVDLKNIYNHIQKQLEGKSTITCYRGLQPYEYLQFVNKLYSNIAPNELITYKASTIVSFRDRIDGYSGSLTIKLNIPIENILMHYSYIETEDSEVYSSNKNGLIYENEVLFLNNDIKGRLVFSREDVLNWEEMNEQDELLSMIENSRLNATNLRYTLGPYHESIFYNQCYLIYLKDYKKHILDSLSWLPRKIAEKDLDFLS
jgi:hypothetical protein